MSFVVGYTPDGNQCLEESYVARGLAQGTSTIMATWNAINGTTDLTVSQPALQSIVVTGRAKFVRSEFVEKIKQSTHWQQQVMVPNVLKAGADIWS